MKMTEERCKRFERSTLCDPPDAIARRCELIDFLASDLAIFPLARHEHSADAILQFQERISGRPPLTIASASMAYPLAALAERLEQMTANGFVHGDITVTNTVWDGQTLHLIDFEPSLRQRYRDRIVVKSPKEIRACRDRSERRVTTRTDRLGFFFLCARLLGHNALRSSDSRIYLGTRSGNVFGEDEIYSRAFTDIVWIVAEEAPCSDE